MKSFLGVSALIWLAACGSNSADGGANGSAKPTASASSSKPATSTAATTKSADPQSSASAATSAGSASPSSSAAPAAGSGSIFAGEPDPSVKLSPSYEEFAGTNLLIQKPVGWELVTARDLGFLLASPDGSAKLLVGDTKAHTPMSAPPADLLPLTAAHDVKAGPASQSTLGKFAIPIQIGDGTARIADQKEDGRIYFFQIDVGKPSDVTAIAVLRAGVKPENEKALIASIRSMKRGSDK